MKMRHRWAIWLAAGLLGTSVGCQTWVPEAGLTMPSPDYLRHNPQYIPPSPSFPLPREQSSLEAATAQQLGGPRPVNLGPGQP